MTTQEALTYVFGRPKWYIGVKSAHSKDGRITPQAAHKIKRRFRSGKLQSPLIEAILMANGYTKNEITWTRSE